MPPLPSVSNVIGVKVRGDNDSAPFENVFHLQLTGLAPNSSDLNTLAGSILSAYTTAFGAILATAIHVTECDVVDLTSNVAASGSANAAFTGTRVGLGLTAQVAIVISWEIQLRYRGGHPRTYLPAGVGEDTLTATQWTPAFITEVQDAAVTFRNSLNALTTGSTTYKMCSVSYRANNAPRPQPLPFVIQGSSVDSRVDTQRRRLGKGT